MADKPQSIVVTQSWHQGVNSLVDPVFLPEHQYQWGANCINRGGPCQSRPGFNMLVDQGSPGDLTHRSDEPRGISSFKPIGRDPFLVKVVGSQIRVAQSPFVTWSTLPIVLDSGNDPVYFEAGIKGAITNDDGTLTRVDPYPILIIQTGLTKAVMWDGAAARFLETTEMPIGTWMRWVGNRMWTIDGRKLHASNLLDPINHTEERNLSGGGYFTLPGEGTGLAATADAKSLLAFTGETTTSFAVTNPRFADPITGLGGWSATPGFQQVILPSIGCIAGRSVLNQYGLIWWYSQGGLIGLDDALNAYRTSRIHYSDSNMARSKGNLSADKSGISGGIFENFLLMSVPSGHINNAHTWVMDEGVIDQLDAQAGPAWAGNWTGLNPVQWVTLDIAGKQRCFCLSKDFDSTSFTSNAWEAFTPIAKDFATNRSGAAVGVFFPAEMESKYLSENTNIKKFSYVEYMLADGEGEANIRSSYASRHSVYKQVMDKDLRFTVANIHNDADVGNDVNLILAYLPQTRRLRTGGDTAQTTDGDTILEDTYTRNQDKGFFVLTRWTGQLAITSMALVCEYATDPPRGSVQQNEDTERYITSDFGSFIGTDPFLDPTPVDLTSRTIAPISTRRAETRYNVLD